MNILTTFAASTAMNLIGRAVDRGQESSAKRSNESCITAPCSLRCPRDQTAAARGAA